MKTIGEDNNSILSLVNYPKNIIIGAGQMTQWLRPLIALPEKP